MDKDKLIEYLENVVELEKQVYLQSTALNELDEKINSLGYANDIQVPAVPQTASLDQEYMGNFARYGAISGTFLSLIIIFTSGFYDNSNIFCTAFNLIEVMIPTLLICLPVCTGIGYLIGFVCACSKRAEDNDRLAFQRRSNTDLYNRLKKEDEERVQNELEQRSFLCSEYDTLYAQYEDTCKTLQRFYDTNIIYGKYHHDFAAVASFLDYFKSGRCSTLGENRGGDGAYNTYENELFHKIIINKLDLVIDNLNEIKQNQYSLAVAISEGNQISHNLVSATERLALAQERTAENSAITAYSSQQAANELNQIKWLEIWGQM